MAEEVLALAGSVLDAVGGAVDAVGIANQRGSTIVWQRGTGKPIGPGIGWQDLRTVGRCLDLRGDGFRLAPNASATKLEYLLDAADPQRTRDDLCFGTVDTWVAWTLSGGAVHATDASNAAITGLLTADAREWNADVLDALRIPRSALPAVVDSSGVVGAATALSGAPPIAGLAGDQQASLLGQGCAHTGAAKITFGTGGMLDLVLGTERPEFETRGPAGTFPIVCRRRDGLDTWGLEAIVLTAGTAVEWLRDDLGVIGSAAESHDVARACDAGDVWFVPALFGLGTPQWDYGARGTLLGLTRGTSRRELVRAVLEGVAHRGADLLEAAESDSGIAVTRLRVDSGMSDNPTFVQCLADAAQRTVEVSPVREATALGAAFLAGLAVGAWKDEDALAATWSPRAVVHPGRLLDRERWREACRRAERWLPDLSAVEF
jgi:glycerol kinase